LIHGLLRLIYIHFQVIPLVDFTLQQVRGVVTRRKRRNDD
jgi:hypothetical protein